ncbi:uncharacterized protein LOC144665416 [Oculina patagonica]
MLGVKATTDTVEEDEKQFNNMKSLLTNQEPRFILYDFGFTNKEGRKINKLVLIFWKPSQAGIKDVIVYTATMDDVVKALGFRKLFKVDDLRDLDYMALMKEVERMTIAVVIN